MIPMLDTEEAARRFKAIGEQIGEPVLGERMSTANIGRLMSQNPALAAAWGHLVGYLLLHNTVNTRTRELVVLRIAWLNRCLYMYSGHIDFSRAIKMTDEEIFGVREPDKCKAFNEADRAVIAMTDELHARSVVSAATMATLQKHFPIPEIVELLIYVGFWRGMCGVMNTAELPLEPGRQGWPEGRAPA